ncbi:RNA-guided endonuclease TnpB family protein [Atopococcus tabaci]|uniref:RNA-guided endonuclease TnpB family protein n=1 Tax=Atopococcus tabaci TaxID=269774 RepID=UPI0003FD7CC3|nr:RNA-guided endonuclease TnpB family protein [Atopococcus tabaci]
MLKGIKIKIYPNQEQIQFLEQNIGNARFVWNQMLNMWNTRYQNNPNLPALGKYDLSSLLPTMKKEYEFLKKSESTSLQFVCETLHGSFVEFFKKARRHPRFKSKKKATPSFTVKNNKNIELKKNAIKLPKIGWMKARWSDNVSFDKIKQVTITRTPSGYYKASVLVESESQVLDKIGKQIGLDMGQSDLMIGSDGTRVETRTYKKYERKLKQWQRKASRRLRLAKEKGTPLEEAKNYQKSKRMVAKYHEKIRNCRQDYLHKATKKIVIEYDFIAVEDLRIKGMLNKKNSKLNNHAIANQSWYELRTMFEYKSDWYGKTFVKVDPKYTSQDCSNCQKRTGPKNDLSVRQWVCPNCKTKHDRDINAGRNILNKALIQVG